MRRLLPALHLVLGWLVVFAVFRAVLIASTWYLRGGADWGLVLGSMLRGLRFDAAVAAELSAAFALWAVWRRSRAGRGERWVVWGLFAVVSLLAIFTLVAEIEYYKEFQMRVGPLALQYFGAAEHNQIVLGMIWHGYPVVRWLLVCLLGWSVFLWATRRVLFRCPPVSGSWGTAVSATVVLAAAVVLLGRGGWQSAPLRWGNSIWSQNEYANHMTINGVFALISTLRHLDDTKLTAQWRRLMATNEAVTVMRSMTLMPGETLVQPETYPLLRRSPASALPLVKRPRHVVLVMMESFTARFCGATGAGFGATPCFDALAREGILFDRAFSVSTHTAPGVFGTLCSFPTLPQYDATMKHPLGNQPFRSLPAIFSEQGFATLFLYNGLFSWDNKEGFLRAHGAQRLIGRADYVNPSFVDPDWGVADHDVFGRAVQEFDQLAQAGKRFCGVIITLSNHAPFTLPQVGLTPITVGGTERQRLNGVQYADWAIGQFMAQARSRPWFEETLFVFVGDHGFGIPPVLTQVNLLHEHVPLLFYGPGVLGARPEVRHQVASQLDVLPSILGLFEFRAVHQSFGRDLFSLPATDPGHAYVRQSGDPVIGFIQGDELVTTSIGQAARYHQYRLGFPPSTTEDQAAQQPARTRELERQLQAFVVTGLMTLEQHRAAPETRSGPAPVLATGR